MTRRDCSTTRLACEYPWAETLDVARHNRVLASPRTWSVLLAILAVLAGPAASFSQTLEPPPEAPEGEDYEIEMVDELDDGTLEMSVGAAGRSGGGPRRMRSVRFSADSLDGGFRHGVGDPLSGGSLEGRLARGTFRMGRMAPRWGRGLLLGGAPDPWTDRPDDRGARARFRGRSGDGASFASASAGARSYEWLYGRFDGRHLAGVRGGVGPASLGAVAAGRAIQGSFGVERPGAGGELALDRDGRWRSEAAAVRRLGTVRLGVRVRGGSNAFRSLAEPARTGPSRALAAWSAARWRGIDIASHASMWRFRPGLDGARLALGAERRSAGGLLRIGFEEQHGARRANGSGARDAGMRQGWWWWWRGERGAITVTLRHETWGRRSFARDRVRMVTAARIEAASRAGLLAAVTHTVYRAASGEHLYLAESGGDRLVLRALSGAGTRTRIEARVPFAGGALRATAAVSVKGSGAPRAQWTFDWTRRARFRRHR